MIQLTVRCRNCKSSITARSMRLTKKGITPSLKEVLQQYNFHQHEDYFLCDACYGAQVKKAG